MIIDQAQKRKKPACQLTSEKGGAEANSRTRRRHRRRVADEVGQQRTAEAAHNLNNLKYDRFHAGKLVAAQPDANRD